MGDKIKTKVSVTSKEGVLVGVSGGWPITLEVDGERVNLHDWLERHLGDTLVIIAVEPHTPLHPYCAYSREA